MKNGKYWKRFLHRLLFPGAAVLLAGIMLSTGLLIYAFGFARGDEPLVYLAYGLSFYTLVAVCARIPRLVRGVSVRLHRNRCLHRYLTDFSFRTHVSLYLSLGINLLYAVMKLCLGVYYRSVWFGTFGVYYAQLTAMRFLLLRHLRWNSMGEQLAAEWRRYRLCGAILLPMTAALSGVVILVIESGEGFRYPGYLIYAVALYAFYAVTAAIVHVIRYRKYHSPVVRAAKAIHLASALVSMLSLETAMLSQFGGADQAEFRLVMTAATGAGVCLLILGMAVFMLIHGGRQLRSLPSAH